MSAPSLDTISDAPPRVPVLRTHADAVRAAQEVADLAASGAARRDRDRRLPYAEVEVLKRSGLLAITVPPAYGGPGLPPSTAAEVFRIIGEADPNLAQIPHSHFVYVNFLLLAGTETQRRDVLRRVVDGALLANAQTERSGRTVAEISTTLSPDGRGSLVLEGTKYYCTGTLFADVVPVLARLDDPRGDSGLPESQHVVLVPITETGIAVADDWDAVGQRTTASGTVHIDHVLVRPDQVVPRGTALSGDTGYGAFAQLLHSAIDVGIARGALAEATAFVRDKSRPWWEAEVESAVDDPLTVQRVGELVVDVVSAEAVLAHAAAAVDAVFAAPGPDRAADASLAVASLRVVAERSSLAVASGLFEVSGTRAAGAGERLDRYWRNARTHTLHDPTRWKLQHLGRHALTGQAPPSHGQL